MRSWLKAGTALAMSPTDAAWLAGFFDGEGSVVTYLNGRNKKYRAWRMQVPNTHHGSLIKCRAVTGCGAIKPKKVVGNRKPTWFWTVDAQNDVLFIFKQIEPYLTVKKEKVIECINALDSYGAVVQRQETTVLETVQ